MSAKSLEDNAELVKANSDAMETALTIQNEAIATVVKDQAGLSRANSLLHAIKQFRIRVEDEFGPGIDQAFKHHRYFVAQLRRFTDPIELAERVTKMKISDYLEEQDRLRLEAERAAWRAKEAAAAVATEASDNALGLMEKGEMSEADVVLDKAAAKIEEIQASAPAVPDKPIAPGTSLRETWTYEIVEESIIPRKFLVPNYNMLRGYASNMKHQASVLGVRFYSVKSVMTRLR